jgi:DNA-binding transcriptional LysR family regulator
LIVFGLNINSNDDSVVPKFIVNIHYLELFYYVAKHGGISQAVRQIPYGIQQPAVSMQILLLEDDLGTKLFQRRPFALTPTGERLYAHIRPFFDRLDSLAEELRGGAAQRLRIGASELVFRDHFPAVVQQVRGRFPQLKLVLRSGYQPQLEDWLQSQHIDVAVTILDSAPPPGIKAQPLIELPLVLLLPQRSRIAAAADLWASDKIEEPLICLPPTESVCKRFQEGLGRLDVDWLPSIEASSLEMIELYVRNGNGIGLTVAVPRQSPPKGLRVLPLEGFKPIVMALLWQREPTVLMQAFLEECQHRAESLK